MIQTKIGTKNLNINNTALIFRFGFDMCFGFGFLVSMYSWEHKVNVYASTQ